MSTDTYVTDVPLGSIQPGPVQFIRQLVVHDSDAQFELTLPGRITRCEGASAYAVRPYGMIALAGSAPLRSALVTAGVADEPGLTRAIFDLTAGLRTRDFAGFAIRLASHRHSFADVVARAEEAAGGCKCSGGASIFGSIRVGLSDSPGAALTWTEPVAATIAAKSGAGAYDGPLDPNAGAIGIWPHIFDCNSDWSGVKDRHTSCGGGCPGTKICACGRNKTGVPTTSCDGWVLCVCM
jgi:hypothetical protein